MNWVQYVFRSIDWLNARLSWPAIGCLWVIIGSIFFEVVARYVFNRPTDWAMGISLLAQTFLPMIGVGWLLREEGHVMVELLVERLTGRPRLRNWLFFATSLLGVIYCATMAWTAWPMWQSALATHERSYMMSYPTYPSKLMVLIGFCLFGLQFMARAYNYYQQARTGSHFGVNDG